MSNNIIFLMLGGVIAYLVFKDQKSSKSVVNASSDQYPPMAQHDPNWAFKDCDAQASRLTFTEDMVTDWQGRPINRRQEFINKCLQNQPLQ